jgi:hypothetical protein
MSSSAAEDAGDRPLDDDNVLLGPPGDAALLARDRLRVVAVPMLADLDVVRELPAGDARPPSTSSSPGRGPKLRPRRASAPRAPAEVSSIHRVALKESRNRTFLIASWRLPRIDDRFLFLGAFSSLDGPGSGTAMDGRPCVRSSVEPRTRLFSFLPRSSLSMLRSGVVTSNPSGAAGELVGLLVSRCGNVESRRPCLVCCREFI